MSSQGLSSPSNDQYDKQSLCSPSNDQYDKQSLCSPSNDQYDKQSLCSPSSDVNDGKTTKKRSKNKEDFPPSSPPVIYNASINVRNDFILPIPVSSDCSVSYKFTTKPKDISFGMVFKTSSGDEIVLRKKERLETHIAAAIGTIHCPDQDGVLYLQWDNSYSWLTAKELSYEVELIRACTKEGMTEMKNKISALQAETSEKNTALATLYAINESLNAEKIAHNEIILESHKQIKVLNEKLTKTEEECHSLENKLAESTQSLEITTQSLTESQQLLQIANRKMEEEILRIVTEEKSKREKLEVEVKKLSSEVIASKAFFDEMETFHKGREKHLEDQVTSSKDQIAEMQKVIESDISTKKYRELIKGSYEDSVNDMKALFQAEKEVLVGKVEGLQLEIEVFIEEIETLKIEKAKHNDEIQEKAEIIEKLAADCNKWVTSLKDLKSIFSSEKEVLDTEVKTLRAENAKLTTDIKGLEATNEKLREEQINWINSRESDLTIQSGKDADFEDLKNQYRTSMDNFNVLQVQHESTAQEYADLKISYQKASNEIKELHCSLLEAKASIEESSKKLEKHVATSVASAKQAKHDYEELSNKYNKAIDDHNAFAKSVEMANQLSKTETSTPNVALEAEKIKTRDLETKLKGLQLEFTTVFKNFEDLKELTLSKKEVIDKQQLEIEKLQKMNTLYLERIKNFNDHRDGEVEVKAVDNHDEKTVEKKVHEVISKEIVETVENYPIKERFKDDNSSEISFASVTSSVAINKSPVKENSADWSLAGFFTRL